LLVSPMRNTCLPMAWKSGSSLASTASSPPTMKIKLPACAATFEPVTGASIYSTPLARRRSANWSSADGEIVLESTTIAPDPIVDSTPCGPNNTASTALVSDTHIHTTSASLAASAGDSATRAPSIFLPGVRFQTATSFPAFTRLAAIGPPMIPSPRKATRIAVVPHEFCIQSLVVGKNPRARALPMTHGDPRRSGRDARRSNSHQYSVARRESPSKVVASRFGQRPTANDQRLILSTDD